MYFADTAQRVHEENRQKCGARNKVLACIELVSFAEERILRVGEVVAGHGHRVRGNTGIIHRQTLHLKDVPASDSIIRLRSTCGTRKYLL